MFDYTRMERVLSSGSLAHILAGMQTNNTLSNWLAIDRSAIAENLHLLQDLTKTRVMAVIKANGYGHGIVEMARVAFSSGVAFCGVSRLEEAIMLRQAGIEGSIMVLGYTPAYGFDQAFANDISLAIFNLEYVPEIIAAAKRVGRKARIHIKVETGMGRLGAPPEVALELLRLLGHSPEVRLEGIFTHFACADDPSAPATAAQEKIFAEVIRDATAADLRPELVHAANSAATLTRASTHFDMVRIGIAMYGLAPSDAIQLPQGLRPALTWKAQMSMVHSLPQGSGISYGHTYITKNVERIGVVPVGYGDGYRRVDGSEVLVSGRKVPVVGRVCMDEIMIQLDQVPDAKVGDEVVLIGKQGDETIKVKGLADLWGTINYEVICGLSARVPRLYYG